MSAQFFAMSTSSLQLANDGATGTNPNLTRGSAYGRGAPIILIVLLTASLVGALVWIVADPQARNWDEAAYVNQVNSDYFTFQAQGAGGYLSSFLTVDTNRPPAYRLLAAPLSLGLGVLGVAPLRLLSLAGFGFSLWLLYAGARKVADPTSSLAAVLLISVCPVVLGAAKNFGTEYPSYLAVSAVTFLLLHNWDSGPAPSRDWLLLGLALGFGAWSKLSVLGVTLPMVALAFLFGAMGWIRLPRPIDLVKACGLGLVLAAPWFLRNWRNALQYSSSSLAYSRHSLGPSLGQRLLNWPLAFSEDAVGLPAGLVLIALFAGGLLMWARQGGKAGSRPATLAAVMCLAGFLPTIVVQIAENNQNMRLIAPALLPLGVCLGILASVAGVWRSRLATSGLILVMSLQLGVMLANSSIIPGLSGTFAQTDSWDWGQLRELAISNRTPSASIAYLGNGSLCNPPQISAPWVSRNEKVQVTWLWRYENGDIRWDKLMASLDRYDIIFTLPGYVGNLDDRQNLDNASNAEFLRLLEQDPRFERAVTLYMGRDRVPVVVFVKRSG